MRSDGCAPTSRAGFAASATIRRSGALSDRIQGFLAGEGIDRFADRDTLAGKPLSTRHSPGMVAATAVAGFAATPVPTSEQRYVDGMLQLLSLMHCSGHFRVIDGPEGAVRG